MSDSIPAHSAPEFALVVRGYDRLQVETYVDRLRDQLEECIQRLHRTEERAAVTARERNARISELEHQVSALEQRRLDHTAPTFSSLGERIAQMLDLAAAEGAAMKERAAREAEEILEQARRQVQDLERNRSESHDRLQRQLYQLRDTVMSLLGNTGSTDVERQGAGAPDVTEQHAALANQVTQAMDQLAVEDGVSAGDNRSTR